MKVAAISYDSAAALRHFAQRKGITYPLLSDPESRVIRAFGILNENFPPGHFGHGAPFPGYYVLDEKGAVRAKYFEEDHADRYTASNVLVRESGGNSGAAGTEVETRRLKLEYWASDSVVHAGNRLALVLEVALKPGMHVYAPGVEGGYIPIEWQMPDSTGWLAHPPSLPASEKLRLPAIQETVPVYQGRFRLTRDLTIGQRQEIGPLVGPQGELVVEGSLRYQACDDKVCYMPETVPLKWVFRMEQQDPERAPAELRRPAKSPQ